MTRSEAIQLAIRSVYEPAISPENWPSALVSVTEAIGGHKAMLSEQTPGAPGRSISSGLDVENASRLLGEFDTRLPDWIRAIPVGAPMRQSSPPITSLPNGSVRRPESPEL